MATFQAVSMEIAITRCWARNGHMLTYKIVKHTAGLLRTPFLVLSRMRPLSIIFITVLLALTNALLHSGPLVIPIHKRLALTNDGIVDLAAARSHIAYSERYVTHLIFHCTLFILSATTRKYLQGLAASSSGSGTLTQRAVGAAPLTDQGNVRWYGTISVGSPAVEYEGEPLVHVVTRLLIFVSSGIRHRLRRLVPPCIEL